MTFLCGAKAETQGFKYGKQVMYHCIRATLLLYCTEVTQDQNSF